MLVDRVGPTDPTAASLHGHQHHHHHHNSTNNNSNNNNNSSSSQHHTPRALSSPMGQLRYNPAAPSPLPSPKTPVSSLPSTSNATSNPTFSSTNRRQNTARGAALKVVFYPPAKYAESQIKQELSHELHKFGKTLNVNLVPAHPASGVQARVALVVFRKAEDEEKAYLAYRNGSKLLFDSRVDVELCSSAGKCYCCCCCFILSESLLLLPSQLL